MTDDILGFGGEIDLFGREIDFLVVTVYDATIQGIDARIKVLARGLKPRNGLTLMKNPKNAPGGTSNSPCCGIKPEIWHSYRLSPYLTIGWTGMEPKDRGSKDASRSLSMT